MCRRCLYNLYNLYNRIGGDFLTLFIASVLEAREVAETRKEEVTEIGVEILAYVIKVRESWEKPVKYFQGESHGLSILTQDKKQALTFEKSRTAVCVANEFFNKGVWNIEKVIE